MKIGKLADAVYGRSVHKKLKKLPETIFHGAAGDDCAMFSLEGKGTDAGAAAERSVGGRQNAGNQSAGDQSAEVQRVGHQSAAVFTQQVVYAGEHCGKYGVYAAVNQAAMRLLDPEAGTMAGGRPAALILSLMLPADAQESLLQQIVEEARKAGERCGVPVADVSASVTGAVNTPVLTVTAVGMAAQVCADTKQGVKAGAGSTACSAGSAVGTAGARLRAKAGMDVVMTKWAGLEGSAILADIRRDELLKRYPAYLVDDAAEFDGMLSVVEEVKIAAKAEICAMCAAGEGGVFRALWQLGTQAGTGLEILLKKIPIRQETVEICNHLDLNPYELVSGGSLLLIAPQGEALVQEFSKAGIPAAVIGTVTDNNDRVIVNGEERRFLEPAKADEIFKMTGK